MVEPQPSKLMVRVRFPSPAPLDCVMRLGSGAGCAGARRPGSYMARGVAAAVVRQSRRDGRSFAREFTLT